MTQDRFQFPRRFAPFWLVVPVLLAACEPGSFGAADAPPEPGVLEATRNGPAGAPEGSCWGKTVSPAVVQTVTQQIQTKPAKINKDGTIGAPPKYRTETTQQIVSPRTDNWFETPCAEALTPEFIETLQRALFARGLYAGVIDGVLNADTRAAVQRFQQPTGPDSPVLSLDTARKLGLIAIPRAPTE